jgi:hypothetical protein
MVNIKNTGQRFVNDTTKNIAFCHRMMPGARTPGKFARSYARNTPGKSTLGKMGQSSCKTRV